MSHFIHRPPNNYPPIIVEALHSTKSKVDPAQHCSADFLPLDEYWIPPKLCVSFKKRQVIYATVPQHWRQTGILAWFILKHY